MELKNIDLNLLVSLDALLTEQSVSKAAVRVGLSQPGMSSALGRLRKMFDDPILVRDGQKLVPTSRASALIEPVRHALQLVDQAVNSGASFDPQIDRGHVRISCSDYSALLLIAPLITRLAQEAPGVTIEVLPRSADPSRDLRSSATDLIVEPAEIMGGVSAASARLFSDRWLACVWRDNLQVGANLTMKKYLQLGHIVYSMGGAKAVSLIDTHLDDVGLERRIEFTVESFLLAPYLVQGTELVTLILSRAIPLLSRMADVRILEPPLTLPVINQSLWWSPMTTSDPMLRWVRSAIRDVGREIDQTQYGMAPLPPKARANQTTRSPRTTKKRTT